MKTKPVKPRPKLATLAALRSACRDAPVVWSALCEMAAEGEGKRAVIRLEEVSERTGIKVENISHAVTLLKNAGWLEGVPREG